jgi:DNA polymerase-3 subunit alpha
MVHLHLHTSGSVLDGAINIKELVNKVKDMGMTSVGITDHGSMIKLYEFQEECLKENIKPILGCEFYYGEPNTTDVFHLVLLAKDNNGLRNLFRLSSYSFMSNFYSKPRIDRQRLIECHKGLICLTACIGSLTGKLFIAGQKQQAKAVLQDLSDIFSSDLYLEIQPNKIPEQKEYNKFMVECYHLMYDNLIPVGGLVVTTDAHYINKEDAKAHDVMLCIQTGKKVDDANRMRFSCDDFYIKSEACIARELCCMDIDIEDLESAIENTNKIADKCNAKIERGEYQPSIGIENEHIELCKHCNEGFNIRVSKGQIDDAVEAIKRIKYELQIIKDKGYSGYFLIVEDYIKWAKDKGIYVGAGRGSAAGSMVAYILGITNVNPLKYGLLFERMLNPERNSAPDVDSDFDYERRSEVIDYIKEKYGSDKVASIIAEGQLTAKAVSRKVLTAYGFEMPYINRINKSIPDDLNMTIQKAYDTSQEFKDYMIKHNEQFNVMLRLQGLTDHISRHAAGIAICNQKIDEVIPCMADSEDKTMFKTQWHKKILEKVGIYKFDILGLKTLSILIKCVENIKKTQGIDIDLDSINVEDKGIYKILNSSDLSGVFQFDAPAGKQTIERIKPTCFNDIIAGEALCRPGVKEAETYISNKNLNREQAKYVSSGIDIVDEILRETYGAIVYQEQTMLIMNRITGGRWSLGKADSMRKVKDLGVYKTDFVMACSDDGINSDIAQSVYDRFDLGLI